MAETEITFDRAHLTPEGASLIDIISRQSPHLRLFLDKGQAVLAGPRDSDDVLVVVVESELTWIERTWLFGFDSLSPRDWSGKRGLDGGFIPTEDYVRRFQRMYGDDPRRDKIRTWEVPDEVVRAVRRGEIDSTEAINRAGAMLARWCEHGRFRPRLSPEDHECLTGSGSAPN